MGTDHGWKALGKCGLSPLTTLAQPPVNPTFRVRRTFGIISLKELSMPITSKSIINWLFKYRDGVGVGLLLAALLNGYFQFNGSWGRFLRYLLFSYGLLKVFITI